VPIETKARRKKEMSHHQVPDNYCRHRDDKMAYLLRYFVPDHFDFVHCSTISTNKKCVNYDYLFSCETPPGGRGNLARAIALLYNWHLNCTTSFHMDTGDTKTLGEIRKEYILKVLEQTSWDFREASRILKVSEVSLKKEISKIDPSLFSAGTGLIASDGKKLSKSKRH
jgi:hypothetical protein